jgi:hypothetical protein
MPYLISDPVSVDDVDHYIVTIDSNPIIVDGQLDGEGKIRLHYDVTNVSKGSHTVTVAASNMWGDGEPSDPFVFTKALPSKVSGIGLEV